MKIDEVSAHIQALYCTLVPTFVIAIVGLFVGLLAWNSMSSLESNTDAIAWSLSALQIVLAVFAIMLAVGAVVGFWTIRSAALDAARNEARRYMEKHAPELLEAFKGNGGSPTETSKPSLPENLNEEAILKEAKEEK